MKTKKANLKFFEKKGKIKILNKKANLLSIWWVLVISIVGVGVVVGVILFYSSSNEVRLSESKVMSDKISNCLTKLSINDEKFIDNFDLINECNLDSKIIERGSNFYFNISLNYDGKLNSKSYGQAGFEEECKISNVASAKYFPRCYTNNLVLYSKEGKPLFVSVLVGSNNEGAVA